MAVYVLSVFEQEGIPINVILCYNCVRHQPLTPDFPKKGTTNMVGYHGYDNREVDMRGIFYAYGPCKLHSITVEFFYNENHGTEANFLS